MSLLSLCNRWEFTNSWSQSFLAFEGEGESVRLPHTVCQLPLHYANHMDYLRLPQKAIYSGRAGR